MLILTKNNNINIKDKWKKFLIINTQCNNNDNKNNHNDINIKDKLKTW